MEEVTFAMITAASVAGLFAGMLLLFEVGRRIGIARLKHDPDPAATQGGAAEAAVFALLGLLIAFTFSGAASRFEDRRHLIGAEANAIGTAYLRVDLLPADSQPELRDLFRRYVDLRSTVYQSVTDQGDVNARLAAADVLQKKIWVKSLAAAQRPGVPANATMLLMPALNDMIDITTTRVVASQNHPPMQVFVLLAALCLVGALLIGQGTAATTRRLFYPLMFAAILSTTVYVIVDIEYPRLGFIRIDGADQILVDLGKGMR
jgi:hypothetical protein